MSLIDMIFDGGFASACATVVSNPFDVLRTRMQLQGEMRQKGDYEVLYRGLFQGMYKIARDEGVMSLQKGLLPAVIWQVTQNGIRIGLYPGVKADMGRALDFGVDGIRAMVSSHDGAAPAALTGRDGLAQSKAPSERFAFVLCVLSAAVCGVIGAVVSSPFIMVKTRLQSEHSLYLQQHLHPVEPTAAASLSEASTGTQFRYRGVLDALRRIYRDGGLRAMWHGAGIAAQRTMVGSAVQLTGYDYCRVFAADALRLPVSDWRVHVCAAIGASVCVVAFMNPLDVVMTRSYNRHRAIGAHGENLVHANAFKQVASIYRIEGFAGLYKGSVALFSRSAPHNIATFVVLEWLRKMRETHFSSRAYTSGSSIKKNTDKAAS